MNTTELAKQSRVRDGEGVTRKLRARTARRRAGLAACASGFRLPAIHVQRLPVRDIPAQHTSVHYAHSDPPRLARALVVLAGAR